MKLNGFVGKGSGKLGASVFAISGGEQIVRQYNPQVANPSTDAQVAQRAKLKLMSQIAAALASAIAFKKKGLVSARNQFVSANFSLATFADGKASVDLKKLQLTEGSLGIPAIILNSSSQQSLPVHLASTPDARVKAVVYAEALYDENLQISLVDVKIVTEAGQGGNYPATMASVADSAVVFAYGICDSVSAAGVNYDEYIVENGTGTAISTATLAVIEKAITSGATFTQTTAASTTL